MKRRRFMSQSMMAGAALGVFPSAVRALQGSSIKIGIIGLDTSHAPAFAKFFSAPDRAKDYQDFQVVAAYPYGSKDIESSASRIPKYTEEVKGYGVEVVDSIKRLLEMVDVVLLETNDGRPRKEQALQVLSAGKPMFIDKPVAVSLADVVAIYDKARERKVPVFSASSLRYMKSAQQVRYENAIGKVLAADTFSPCTLESHHPDLFWYGIHGVEILFTVMGTGCESVSRFNANNMDVVVGKWKDGRIGTFRGTREGKHDYGGTAYGSDRTLTLGPYDGYDALSVKIAEFFKSQKPPVDENETIEIYAFMEAADESKRRNGANVTLQEVMSRIKK